MTTEFDFANIVGFAPVIAIVIIVYLIAQIFKTLVSADNAKKFIPIICGISGLILGIACYYVAPQLMPATDIFTASAIGIISGLAATGVNQIFKQLGNKTTDTNNN